MPDEFYTAEELADYLKISSQTVRAWIREKKIAAVKFGRAWRITKTEVERLKREGVPEDGDESEPSQEAYEAMRQHAPDLGKK
jgi:excisionase family DNA binding protein